MLQKKRCKTQRIQKILINDNAIIFNPGRSYINEMIKPMGLISTPFISYHDIKVKDVDLIEDAWGLNSEFCDVIDLLGQIKVAPGRWSTELLIEKIRKQD